MHDAFLWDGSKNRSNKAKHGLSFDLAIRAFDNPSALCEFNSTVETKTVSTCCRIAGGELIVLVVYAVNERKVNGKEIYRIISARKASPGERKCHEEAAY